MVGVARAGLTPLSHVSIARVLRLCNTCAAGLSDVWYGRGHLQDPLTQSQWY